MNKVQKIKIYIKSGKQGLNIVHKSLGIEL